MTRQVTITTGEALMLHLELNGLNDGTNNITGLLRHKLPFNIKLNLHKLSSQTELIKSAYDAEIMPVFERLGTIVNDRYTISSDSPNMAEYQKINFELLNTKVPIEVPAINIEELANIEDEYFYQIFAKVYTTQD